MTNAWEPSPKPGAIAARRATCGKATRGSWWPAGAVLLGVLVTGCSLDSLVQSDVLPSGVSDPAVTQTPNGAKAAYVGTLHQFGAALGGGGGGIASSFIAATGLLSDELSIFDPLVLGNQVSLEIDRRELEETQSTQANDAYSKIQKVRGQARQAIGLLRQYRPADSALVGHLYAIQGYAEIFLAELYCSGIPLSTLDYSGDFTYQPGSTTDDVFAHAVALFDTALGLAIDSAWIKDLARVGKGRALLARGQYAAAATAVAAVADGYRYDVTYYDTQDEQNFFTTENGGGSFTTWSSTVPDREGSNGLDWRTSGDPRTQVFTHEDPSGGTNYHPAKYDSTGASPIVVASDIEARLIEAEAALQAGDVGTWLDKLNHLRQTAWTTIVPAVTEPLPDTVDPGIPEARIDLMFRERAFWLFLTGHRQGDLRRLIRQYGPMYPDRYNENRVYPVGPYAGSLNYGHHVNAPVPADERVANTLYTGCTSRDP